MQSWTENFVALLHGSNGGSSGGTGTVMVVVSGSAAVSEGNWPALQLCSRAKGTNTAKMYSATNA